MCATEAREAAAWNTKCQRLKGLEVPEIPRRHASLAKCWVLTVLASLLPPQPRDSSPCLMRDLSLFRTSMLSTASSELVSPIVHTVALLSFLPLHTSLDISTLSLFYASAHTFTTRFIPA